MNPEILDTPKTPAAGIMIPAPLAQECPVQRASCPVQRGLDTTSPEVPAPVGIVAITQKAPVRPQRRFVRMFKPRFAALVQAGKKFQTVRPVPKRAQDMPRPGDLFDARVWLGRPRCSKTSKLLAEPAPICFVRSITIHATGQLEIDGRYLSTVEMEAFARADGFADLAEMLAWFQAEHDLPFTGIVIDWLPF
jgi:hypothetical protein